MQLKTVSDGILEVVDCPDLETQVDAAIEKFVESSSKITTGLQRLVGFRDVYSNYERLLSRLRNWLEKAEAKMELISIEIHSQPYDFWVSLQVP
jgi:predicted secreted protein